VRNTKVFDLVCELQGYEADVDVFDPWADPAEVREQYGLDLVSEPEHGSYDAIVIAVAHDEIRKLGAEGIHAFGRDPHVVYDIKHLLSKDEVDGRL